jgi:hypothetical protein
LSVAEAIEWVKPPIAKSTKVNFPDDFGPSSSQAASLFHRETAGPRGRPETVFEQAQAAVASQFGRRRSEYQMVAGIRYSGISRFTN